MSGVVLSIHRDPDDWSEPGAAPRQVLPEGIGEMAPGPELAAALERIDRGELNGYELVVILQARARQAAKLQAEIFADMAELAHCPADGPESPPKRDIEKDEFAVDEIRAALCLTRRSAESQLTLACRLVEDLPSVWQALRDGTIDRARAVVIVNATDHLDADVAAAVADQVLPEAGDLTTGQIFARLRTLCVEVDPDDARRRLAESVADRRVVASHNPDGTANLSGLQLPPERVASIMDRIHRLAWAAKSGADDRTIDQVRADVFADLLEGRHHSGGRHRATVDIRVNLTTLVGLDDKAGEIPGWGPVIADIARQAVERQPDGEWRVVVTDPDNGAVLWDGTTRRRPTAAQRRHVEARQTTCVFPGCRNPATRSDIDHTTDYAQGGPSLVGNYGPLCRHDHGAKHQGGWKLDQIRPGVYRWTSRHGHTYTVGTPP